MGYMMNSFVEHDSLPEGIEYLEKITGNAEFAKEFAERWMEVRPDLTHRHGGLEGADEVGEQLLDEVARKTGLRVASGRRAAEGEKPEGAGTVKDPLVPKVLDEMFTALGASSLKWDAAFRRSEVNVPKELSGVFADMWFDVAWKKGWGAGNVSLKWNHTNGGSSGYTLGTFYYDAETDDWEWRADSGKRGIVNRK